MPPTQCPLHVVLIVSKEILYFTKSCCLNKNRPEQAVLNKLRFECITKMWDFLQVIQMTPPLPAWPEREIWSSLQECLITWLRGDTFRASVSARRAKLLEVTKVIIEASSIFLQVSQGLYLMRSQEVNERFILVCFACGISEWREYQVRNVSIRQVTRGCKIICTYMFEAKQIYPSLSTLYNRHISVGS